MKKTRLMCCVAMIGLFAVATLAPAQQESTSGTDSYTLPEVTITAQKRTEKLEDVPVSGSVTTSETLTNNNVSDVSDLNNLIPSVQLNGTISGRVPMGIRGISSVSNEQAVGIASGVAIEIDGVPVPSDSFAGNLVEDVQNVEVLKGPQATLGGRTATSGVINYVTRKPTDYFTGGGSITWTDDNEKRVSARVSGPASDKVNFAVSGFGNYTPYPIRNIMQDKTTVNKSYGGRGKVEFKPSEDFDATLTLHYANAEADGFNFVYTYMEPGVMTAFPTHPGLPPMGWTQAEALTGITVNMDNQEFSSPVPGAGAVHEDKDVNLDMNWQLGSLTLSSTTAYQHERQHVVQDLFAINQYIYPAFTSFLQSLWDMGIPDAPPPAVIYNTNIFPHFMNKQDIWTNVSQFSQELKLVSPTDQRISYVAGAFFSSTTVDMYQLRDFFDTSKTGAYVDLTVKPTTETYDLYGRVTSKLTDTVNLVTGLRFNYDRLKYTYDQRLQTGYGPFYSEGSDDSTALVGDISLQKTLNDGTMLYGTYARGYAPKAYNTAAVLQSNDELTPVEQEDIDHFEIGSKGTYFNHTLQMNTSAFYTDYKHYQIQTFVTMPGASFPALNLQSAGEASTRGIELDTTWAPTSTFIAGFNAAYINAKWVKFTDAQCYGVDEATRPANAVQNAAGEWVQDISGKSMPNSPKFKFVVNAEQRFPLPDTVYDLLVGGNYSYRTKAYMTVNENPYAIQDAFGILNLYVTLDRMSGKYKLTLFCNNVFDHNYYSDLEDFWTGPWQGNVVIGQPARDASRYFGLRFDVNF